jgi:hypothetical protein
MLFLCVSSVLRFLPQYLHMLFHHYACPRLLQSFVLQRFFCSALLLRNIYPPLIILLESVVKVLMLGQSESGKSTTLKSGLVPL